MKVKYTTMIVEDMVESVRFYKEVMGFEIDSQYNLGPAGVNNPDERRRRCNVRAHTKSCG